MCKAGNKDVVGVSAFKRFVVPTGVRCTTTSTALLPAWVCHVCTILQLTAATRRWFTGVAAALVIHFAGFVGTLERVPKL